MNNKVLALELRKFLYDDKLKSEFKNLTDEDSLLEMGIIDSVKMLELIEYIEINFGIQVDEDDMVPEHFDSISAIVRYIQKRLTGT